MRAGGDRREGIATAVVDDPRARRLLTIPGIGLVTAASILAVVGDIGRFDRPAKLVSYLGLDPRVRQSGDRPAVRGHISRGGDPYAPALLCEAAHSAVRSPGPLAGFHARLKARRGAGVAIVATARKLAVLVWHLLTKDEDCRFAPEARTAFKHRHSIDGGTGRDAAVATGSDWFQPRPGLGQGCAAGMIPVTPPFATRSTASAQTVQHRPGLDTFIRRGWTTWPIPGHGTWTGVKSL